ncbi:MAG: hypothetical protein WBX14_06260, partial [Candidatus Udaeobacter sp.]
MADRTTLTDCLVLVNEWAALRGVALKASLVSAQKSKTAGFEHLLNIGPTTLDGDTDMRVVAISATHSAFKHRMMVRQLELCPHFQVTLETGLRIFPRVDDRVRRATALDMQAARSVARLAAHVLCVLSLRLQSRVSRGAKVAHDFFVAGLAFL